MSNVVLIFRGKKEPKIIKVFFPHKLRAAKKSQRKCLLQSLEQFFLTLIFFSFFDLGCAKNCSIRCKV